MQANVWQYGEAQDTAQSQTTTGASALANFTASLTVNGSTFSYSFPAYSMTVLDLGKAHRRDGGADDHQGRRRGAEPGHGQDDGAFGLGDDPAGNAGLSYTWATTGTPPAAVTFSTNGTNAASSTTATFSKAGSYTFQVTVSDAGGYIATSSVNVVVNQALSSIKVSPATDDAGRGRPAAIQRERPWTNSATR